MPFRTHAKLPRIALALSGGAARGIAHVGVLRALVENQIPVDFVAGTSAGSIVGAAFAAGMPLKEIDDIGRKMRWRDVGRVTMSRLGVQSNERLEEYLRKLLPITRFEKLPIPLAVVATDLQSGCPVIMRDHGDIPFAVRASCTVPGWFVPVSDEEGRLLVDGGCVSTVPVETARSFKAEIVIAVDVNAEGAKFLGPTSVIGVVLQSMMMVQRTATSHQLRLADCVISPKVGHIRWDEMGRAAELIDAGYEAGRSKIDEIKSLIESRTESMTLWDRFRHRKTIEQSGD
jgi:NTE family protein